MDHKEQTNIYSEACLWDSPLVELPSHLPIGHYPNQIETKALLVSSALELL